MNKGSGHLLPPPEVKLCYLNGSSDLGKDPADDADSRLHDKFQYGRRKVCLQCEDKIKQVKSDGGGRDMDQQRRTFFCPTCQVRGEPADAHPEVELEWLAAIGGRR